MADGVFSIRWYSPVLGRYMELVANKTPDIPGPVQVTYADLEQIANQVAKGVDSLDAMKQILGV